MINPDLVGCLNANSVAWSEHFLNVDIPDEVINHPVLKGLEETAFDIVAMQNVSMTSL